MNTLSDRLKEIYNRLREAYGPQHWWPAEGLLEVMVGAILTQNTNWQGVEKAIANLKRYNLLTPDKLQAMPTEDLAQLIKPAGYFNLKARRLKNLIELVTTAYSGDLEAMAQAVVDGQNGNSIKWSMCFCDFWGSVDTHIMSQFLKYGLGKEISADELDRIGERVWNLSRIFNLKAGFTKKTHIHFKYLFLYQFSSLKVMSGSVGISFQGEKLRSKIFV